MKVMPYLDYLINNLYETTRQLEYGEGSATKRKGGPDGPDDVTTQHPSKRLQFGNLESAELQGLLLFPS